MGIDHKNKILKNIIKRLLIVEDNLLVSRKIFAAKHVVEWILTTTKSPKVIDSFVVDLIRHLEGSTKLAWIEEIFTKLERELNDYNNNQRQEKDTKSKSNKV